jgi:hypothetical protein
VSQARSDACSCSIEPKVSVLLRRGSGSVRMSVMMPWKMMKQVDSSKRKLHGELNDKASKSVRTK